MSHPARMRTTDMGANDIMVLSAEIQYVGGFGQMANIASAMELSARNLRAWAYDIEEAQG